MAKTKLTYKLIAEMARLKADGLTNKDICGAVGISEQTFYRWTSDPQTKLQRELCEQLKKEEAAYKAVLLNNIRDAAIKKNGQWTAAAWLLERKYPEEYSQNRRPSAEETDTAPKIVLGVTVQPADGGAAVTATAQADDSSSLPLSEGGEG